MSKADPSQNTDTQQNPKGEQERDNDALRPDGSTGTSHDSTAQKAARGQGRPKR
ncbi:hypothetical protein VXM67_16015 [Pseudomonas sp. Rh2]|uniref:hypothetical protein n=1 Tax=Pseudomonas TaxID=286 RepID=UPI001427DB59|nr:MULTISPECIES: hypothetical protein [Pseudomonas]MDT8921274.1 hypothetical protein [Pseudomonas taiwanensis]